MDYITERYIECQACGTQAVTRTHNGQFGSARFHMRLDCSFCGYWTEEYGD